MMPLLLAPGLLFLACTPKGADDTAAATVPVVVDPARPDHYFDVPFPSDDLLDANGVPQLDGFPVAPQPLAASIVSGWATHIGMTVRGFANNGPAWFRFGGVPTFVKDATGSTAGAFDLEGVPTDPVVLVAMDGITQTDNVGAIFRNAASFGARGVILSPRASDPFLRKTLRVSMGRAVNLPWARARHDAWPQCLDTLRREHGYAIIAGEDTPNALELARFAPPAKSIVVFGAEQDGVSRAVLDMADAVVKIPMLAPGTELADALASDPPSLNVSIASAVILHHLMA